MESLIRANAELVRTVARDTFGVALDYDETGVRWLDQYIDAQREEASPETRARLPNTLGAFLGECVRLNFRGQWIQDPAMGWSIAITDAFTVYPFNKVQKQLENGNGDSVLAFYASIGPLVKQQRPWWKFW